MPTRISYDGMSRLTAAGYLENGKRNDHFSTSYKYDLMGNILSLRREGLLNSGNYGTIDDLTYSYKGNQVVKIDDAAEESPSYRGAMHFRDYADEKTEYTYDANGNMLTDSNKGITSIDYNVLDLPQCISTKSRALFKENSNDTIYYTYSADGTKLRSTYKKAEFRVYPYNPNVSSTSLNVGTVGMAKTIAKRLKTKYYYCSNLVYDNDNISAILFDGGYASVDDDNGIVMHFYVKDHLGSNRLVVDGNGNIEEVNHYYPFGALMGDRCGVSRNNYKYIGKELDTMYGWNMQDHEARWYDPVVGRWMVTDPLQEKYASVSSYCYAINNPIKYIDFDGNDILLIVWASYKGNIGHAGIAISNYKEVKTKIKVNGCWTTQTRMVQDGTYTYRDLWPGGDGVGKGNFDKNVPAHYNNKKVKMSEILNSDITRTEHRTPDGIVKILSDYAVDQKTLRKLDFYESKNTLYNALTNNCSDYAEAALEETVHQELPVDEKLSSKVTVTTPNQVFKASRTIKGSKLIKDPGIKINKSFIHAVIGSSFLQKLAEEKLDK